MHANVLSITKLMVNLRITFMILLALLSRNSLAEHTLVIAPVSGSVVVNNPADVADDLGSGDAEAVFKQFLRSTLATNLTEELEGVAAAVTTNGLPADYSLTSRKFEQSAGFILTRTETITLMLPSDGSSLDVVGDLVLFLNEVTADTDNVPCGFEGDQCRAIVIGVSYGIWDNPSGSLILFGNVDGLDWHLLGQLITRNQWVGATEEIATEIADKLKSVL